MIELRLKLASRTEERLRIYVEKQFKMSLEKKLREVIIEWIGRAIGNSIHAFNEILKDEE